MRRRKRDAYGNWTWEDIGEPKSSSSEALEQTQGLNLDWRDYIALAIASLETFLLPMVIFILILLGLAFALNLLK
ncbi:MAG: hypothetical protein JRN15_20210 [Nitrososphaerota archaeon]|nr:hypothetical protein [Nitrososphaerota archaeon]